MKKIKRQSVMGCILNKLEGRNYSRMLKKIIIEYVQSRKFHGYKITGDSVCHIVVVIKTTGSNIH